MYGYIIPYVNAIILSILFTVSPIYSYLELISILSLLLLCMTYIYECVYMCSLDLYILLCNRTPWKNNVIEWCTLYKYTWNKKWQDVVV